MSTTERNADTRQLEALLAACGRDAVVVGADVEQAIASLKTEQPQEPESFEAAIRRIAKGIGPKAVAFAEKLLASTEPQAEAQPARCEGFDPGGFIGPSGARIPCQPECRHTAGRYTTECRCNRCGRLYSACMASRAPITGGSTDAPCSDGMLAPSSGQANPCPPATVNPQPAAVPEVPEPAYFIERNADGCSKCAAGTTWDVIFAPTGTALGTSYGGEDGEEQAQDMAEALNEAYDHGAAAEKARADALQAERDKLRADIVAAAGELLVDIPEPGTPMARVMLANAAMRRERDEARAELAASRGQEATLTVTRYKQCVGLKSGRPQKFSEVADCSDGLIRKFLEGLLGAEESLTLYAAPVAAKEPDAVWSIETLNGLHRLCLGTDNGAVVPDPATLRPLLAGRARVTLDVFVRDGDSE